MVIDHGGELKFHQDLVINQHHRNTFKSVEENIEDRLWLFVFFVGQSCVSSVILVILPFVLIQVLLQMTTFSGCLLKIACTVNLLGPGSCNLGHIHEICCGRRKHFMWSNFAQKNKICLSCRSKLLHITSSFAPHGTIWKY